MRKIATQKQPWGQPDVVTKAIPAPTEGWDAISPLPAMDPKRAPILINWVPRPGWVELRSGYSIYSTLGAAPVESLMVRHGPSADNFFAASGVNIYDVSNAAGAPPVVVSGLGSARWQYVNFTPSGGTNVIQLVNGVDLMRQYDGTAWTIPSITGLPGGATTAGIVNIHAQKRRLWYVMANSTVAAFMPIDAISGAIGGTQDLGAYWTLGGFLMAMGSWSVDGGNGPQDYVVFISSRGQVTIFQGTDPTNSAVWNMVGTFNLAPPLGRRCATRVGSDLAIITQQGVLPLSQALPFDPSADRSVSITSRIQNFMAASAVAGATNFGWQIIGYPAQQLAILNVPQVTNVTQVQAVMNVLTGAWTQFQGWNVNCFELFNDVLYMGDNVGNVLQAYNGGADGTNSITADMQCAFSYFDDPGRTKRITMVQPLMVAGGAITPFMEIDSDFTASNLAAPIAILQGGAAWDTAVWDTSTWPIVTKTVNPWLSAEGLGHALAVRMKVNVGQPNMGLLGEFDIGVFDTAVFDQQNVVTAAPVLQVNAFNVVMEMGGYI